MCGISGIISMNESKTIYDEIKKMNDSIIHRGPDGCGYHFGSNFALAHRRLSIIDLSESGHQPMNFDDKYTIVFNGEIYNYKELKSQLTQYTFTSHTDTEVILASYDKWGMECVHHFNGMWSFAIYDKSKNIIFCSRDRFGIKPFYYTATDNYFAFGSEIKQFTTLEGWKSIGNKSRILDFLMFEMFDHTDETLFKDVYQLRGGQNLIYKLENHKYTVQEYYSLSEKKSNLFNFEKSSSEFYNIFNDSIHMHLNSDVKVGSCLSGGLDSSSIVCVANKLLRKNNTDFKQETVSSCFHNSKYDEQEYIDEVVKYTQVKSNKIFPRFDELFDLLDKITWHQDEPFGSTSIFAQWSVFQKAKDEGIIVMLDGQGADEQLAGYPNFYGVYMSELIRKWKFARLHEELSRQKNKINIIKSSIKYLIPNSIKAFIKTKFRADVFEWINIDHNYYKEYLNNLYGDKIKTLQDYSLNQIKYSSLPKLLHYEDRNSMAHSIEARVPFLDHKLVEFVYNLPSCYKINEGVTKYILRNAMKDILPHKVNDRRDKMGFVTPEEIWIKENKDIFKKEIENTCDLLKGILYKDKLLNWYDKLIDSNDKIDFTVWRLVSLGRWIKIFNVTID